MLPDNLVTGFIMGLRNLEHHVRPVFW